MNWTIDQLKQAGGGRYAEQAAEQVTHERAVARKFRTMREQHELDVGNKPLPLEREMQAALIERLEEHGIPFIVSISDFNAFAGHGHLDRLMAKFDGQPLFQTEIERLKTAMRSDVFASINRMKQRGWRKGQFDVCVPMPSAKRIVVGGMHTLPQFYALYMDLKRGKNGRPTEEQHRNAELYRENGNRVEFPESEPEAWAIVCEHCGIEP